MKKLLITLIILLIIGICSATYPYKEVFDSNVKLSETKSLFTIPTGFTQQQLMDKLENEEILKNTKSFELVSKYVLQLLGSFGP